MRPSFLPLLLLFLHFWCPVRSSNTHLSFAGCEQRIPWEVLVLDGAVVTSSEIFSSNVVKGNCSLTLKTTPPSTFLVQLREFSFPSKDRCREHLTLLDMQSGKKFLDEACTVSTHLPTHWFTSGSTLQAVFVRNFTEASPNNRSSSFKLIITSVKASCPGDRSASTSTFRCSKSAGTTFCITRSLRCDSIPHCPKEEDELFCYTNTLIPPFPPLAPTTDQSLAMTTPADQKESLYLWLPLIVVVAFTIIMLSLILLGRRATGCVNSSNNGYTNASNVVSSMMTLAERFLSTTTATTTTLAIVTGSENTTPEVDFESDIDIITIALVAGVFFIVLVACLVLGFREQRHRNNQLRLNDDLRVEINSNPGFTDGAPATPPPTYSMIERQTSYVSNISQTSSQLSIPPDYNDVVDLDESLAPNRRRRINSARSSSSSSWRRPRRFQRSHSAQEPYSPSRHRLSSDRSDASIPGQTNSVGSDTDSVFADTPSRSSVPTHLSLGNLSEVDESLVSSSVILDQSGTEGSNNNNREGTISNAEIHLSNENHSNNQGLPDVIAAQPRPPLQRSMSDITETNTVRFTLGE